MKREFFFPLNEIPQNKLSFLGGKAFNFLKIRNITHVKFPETWVLLSDALYKYVSDSFSGEEISILFRNYLKYNNRAPLFAKLAHAAFPKSLEDEIFDTLPQISLMIIRSSGIAEDSAKTSLAGHYESIITKVNREDIIFTIKACWLVGLRVYLDHVLYYNGEENWLEIAHKALNSISLVFQEIINPEKSGIYFTQSPIHKGKEFIVANLGTCHSSVDGNMSADYFILEKGKIDSSVIRFKFEMTVFNEAREDFLPGEEIDTPLGKTRIHFPYGDYLSSARVPYPYDYLPALDEDEIRILYNTTQEIKKALDHEIDMEWAFSEKELYILQVRPITTETSQSITSDSKEGYLTASPGVIRGRVKIVHSSSDIHKVEEGDIIAVKVTDPDYMPIIYRCAGIIAEDGSPLCHTAIVARELKIPCLLGVQKATSGAFADDEIVTLDANRGIIFRDEEEVEWEEEPLIENDIIYDLDHLKYFDEKEVKISVSSLLYGFYRETGWNDPAVWEVKEFIEKLKTKHDLSNLLIHWDISDDKNIRQEADSLIVKLKEYFDGEGLICRE